MEDLMPLILACFLLTCKRELIIIQRVPSSSTRSICSTSPVRAVVVLFLLLSLSFPKPPPLLSIVLVIFAHSCPFLINYDVSRIARSNSEKGRESPSRYSSSPRSFLVKVGFLS